MQQQLIQNKNNINIFPCYIEGHENEELNKVILKTNSEEGTLKPVKLYCDICFEDDPNILENVKVVRYKAIISEILEKFSELKPECAKNNKELWDTYKALQSHKKNLQITRVQIDSEIDQIEKSIEELQKSYKENLTEISEQINEIIISESGKQTIEKLQNLTNFIKLDTDYVKKNIQEMFSIDFSQLKLGKNLKNIKYLMDHNSQKMENINNNFKEISFNFLKYQKYFNQTTIKAPLFNSDLIKPIGTHIIKQNEGQEKTTSILLDADLQTEKQFQFQVKFNKISENTQGIGLIEKDLTIQDKFEIPEDQKSHRLYFNQNSFYKEFNGKSEKKEVECVSQKLREGDFIICNIDMEKKEIKFQTDRNDEIHKFKMDLYEDKIYSPFIMSSKDGEIQIIDNLLKQKKL